MPDILYFAYGSNMCTGRLTAKKRCPSARPKFIAKLLGHRLYFHKISTDGSAKADAEFTGKNEDIVWGVVFSIDNSEEDALDNAEGEGRGYNKDTIDVIDRNDEGHQVKIYRADRDAIDKTLRPYSWYKRFVVEGARQHSLPEDYIDQINQFEDVEDHDKGRDAGKRAIQC